MCAKQGCRVREGDSHVVAVADVRDGPAPQRPPALAERQTVRDGLARMLLVGQRVDDMQLFGRGRELLEQPMRERADDDRVHPSCQVARDVGHRFPASERRIGQERHHMTAELAHGDLESRTRPKRRLLEEHGHVTAAQEVGGGRLSAKRSVGLYLRG